MKLDGSEFALQSAQSHTMHVPSILNWKQGTRYRSRFEFRWPLSRNSLRGPRMFVPNCLGYWNKITSAKRSANVLCYSVSTLTSCSTWD
ncbi:hypothetical protein P879_08294 [Paragonimus westermani]|uniref:Uncharacterized protein n=1 Tax=Paragonimus westermani TaxID=34504 RepID=A0A8T0DNI9_9TREM|nr:hypothetical protein P879_08294 [Paragonimus westermani]